MATLFHWCDPGADRAVFCRKDDHSPCFPDIGSGPLYERTVEPMDNKHIGCSCCGHPKIWKERRIMSLNSKKMKETDYRSPSVDLKEYHPVAGKRVTTPEDVRALRAGDSKAFDRIFKAWNRPILNTLAKLTGSREEAEDITQNVFISLWESREKLDPDRKINTYLYMVARRSAVDYFRRKRVAGEYLESMDWDELDRQTSDSLVIEKEIKLVKDMALSLMPEYRRNIYILSQEEGLGNEEIAERLGISVTTVYTEKSNARKQLKDLIRFLTILLMLS